MVNQPSSQVRSSQQGVHPRLAGLVCRHVKTIWNQPLHAPTVEAFKRLSDHGDFSGGRELILDSGCGTGESTHRIADAFPEAMVLGVDRSKSRLSRLGHTEFPYSEGNATWLQGELATFWRLARQAGWRLSRHYLLYPNPWPKPGQVQRRWHAHPVFPDLLALGGMLEMRCNWEIYANEFAAALGIAFRDRVSILSESAKNEQSWLPVETPFGRKYARSGHRLYRVRVDLGDSPVRLVDDPVE